MDDAQQLCLPGYVSVHVSLYSTPRKSDPVAASRHHACIAFVIRQVSLMFTDMHYIHGRSASLPEASPYYVKAPI